MKTSSLERATVVLIIDDLCPGGAERQLVELANGLDKRRFQAIVVTLVPGQPLEEEVRGRDGVKLFSLQRKGKYDFGILAPLVRLLRREGAHVVQPFLTPAMFFALSGALLVRAPVKIMTERCGVRRHMTLGERLYQVAEDRLARFVDAAVANSESGREFLIDRGIQKEKTRVIYNGVNADRVTTNDAEVATARASLGIPEGAPVVGIVASLTPAKDYPTFLRSAALIRETVADAHFVIVGDGALREKLETQTAQFGLADCVHFAGYQMRVAPFIKTFDVALLSSCDYEGCSNFILEAMGLGRPIVATDIGGNRELIENGETGLLVIPKEPHALAEGALALLRSSQFADRLTAKAQARFESEFTVATMVAQYERLYEELLLRKGLTIRSRHPVAHATVAGEMEEVRR